MKRIFISVLMVALSHAAFAGFVDGHKLLAMSQADERVKNGNGGSSDQYVSIAYEAYLTGVIDSNDTVRERIACPPAGFTPAEAKAIVSAFLKLTEKNPDFRTWSGQNLVVASLAVVHPCKKIDPSKK